MVLHEIAHWLVRPKVRAYFYGGRRPKRFCHDKRFYRKLFRLFKFYNIPYCDFKYEFGYKPRASHKAFTQIYKCTWL